MKGDGPFGDIRGIIVIVIILAIVIGVFLLPSSESGTQIINQKKFWYYCPFWAQYGYRGTQVIIDGTIVNLNEACEKELGLMCPPVCMPEDEDNELWEKCRNVCKLQP